MVSLISSQGFARGILWGRGNQQQAKTEAGYSGFCENCINNRPTGSQPLAPIDVNYVGGKGTLSEARAHFELYARNNAECRPTGNEKKYGMISDLSSEKGGTAFNLSHIVEVDSQGKTKIVASFWAGEGVGVGNDCGSNESPHGFMKMGSSDYRPDVYRTNPETGQREVSKWPMCGAKNPVFNHNRIMLHGLERGFNDNLSETNVAQNPNNPILCRKDGRVIPRYARLHSIGYSSGNTTLGCKGLQLDIWCKYAPSLIGGCAYNYDGSETPAIRRLKGTADNSASKSDLGS